MAIVDPRDFADEEFPNPRKALLRPLLRQQSPKPLLTHLRENPEPLGITF